MKYEIKNRVSESKLITIDFNDFLTGLYIEEFDLKKVVDEIESTIKPLVEKNSNILKIDYNTKAQNMIADVTKIRQILLNLLSNSAKFTKEGTISISIEDSKLQNDAMDFIISDTGIGMTKDQVD